AGRVADPSIWRVARSVLVTDSDSEADDILADPEGVFSDYYYYLNTHMKLASGTLTQPHDPAAERAEAVKKAKSLVIAGSRRRVLDQLIAFCEQVGDFGHLVITGHDMDGRHEMWRRSFTAIAEEIAPRLTQHREGRRRVA
ncbi:MAG: LLM class flavin-dependent oxidoreductase, partial [Pseudomonadota bacterium]|nr:LLM class flavin-dependent oxidoreductase [Pseudomonadota bacterium]